MSANIEQKIWQYFKAKGLNDFGIAGLMGNLYAESALNSKNLQNVFEKKLNMTDEEYTKAVDNGTYANFVKDSAGYGLAQWTYWTRKQKLLNYAREKNKSIGDLDMQLDFLYEELKQSFKAVLNSLCNANSVLEASNVVLLQFEKPGDQSETVQNKRASYSNNYYNKYSTKNTIVTQQTTIGGDSKMKYTKNNPPLVCMQTNSSCYNGTTTMTIKGILWHSTGANNPNLKRYVQPSTNDPKRSEILKLIGKNTTGTDWNSSKQSAGLNAWIGKTADGSVTTIQSMPWNYRPWGCGSGKNGSCNSGWIQFEICEDDLTSKDYFNKTYQEAVELTAYLCTLYGLNPKGTAVINGVKTPVILCHADAYKLGLGSNHGDVLHWFKKYGKTMDDVRNDVAKLMGSNIADSTPTPVQNTQVYRVRKTFNDAASQKGAYMNLNNAKKACDEAGAGYCVFDASGNQVYPVKASASTSTSSSASTTALKVGDKIKLKDGATYSNGKAIPSWVFKTTLYCREINKDGTVVFSTQPSGAITGVVKYSVIQGTNSSSNSSTQGKEVSYKVKITADVLNVRKNPTTESAITCKVKKNDVYTIVSENNGWGKLKSGAGWISLSYAKKI